MVVKSRDPLFKIPKTTQNCSSKLNSTEHVWILVSATKLRSLYLVQHSQGSFFSCSQVWKRLDQDETTSPSQTDQWYTCEPKLIQLACRSLCIPSYRRCSLSIGKYHGNSRAGLPHRCGRGELRLRNFGSPRTTLSLQNSVRRWVVRDLNALHTFKKCLL